MKCPVCGFEQSTVIDSRPRGEMRHRRYRCDNCGERYNTEERVVPSPGRGRTKTERYESTLIVTPDGIGYLHQRKTRGDTIREMPDEKLAELFDLVLRDEDARCRKDLPRRTKQDWLEWLGKEKVMRHEQQG